MIQSKNHQVSRGRFAPPQVFVPTWTPPVHTEVQPEHRKPCENTPSVSTSEVPSITERPKLILTPKTPNAVEVVPEVVPVRKSSRTSKPLVK